MEPTMLLHHNDEGTLKKMTGFFVAYASARTKMKLINARANPVMRQSNVSFNECVNAPINAKQNALKSIQPRADMFLGLIKLIISPQRHEDAKKNYCMHLLQHSF